MARSDTTTLAAASLSLAQQLLPSADPSFLSSCISHHLQSSTSSSFFKNADPAVAAARVVELVSHKLLEESPPGWAGEWPTVKCWKVVEVEDVELPLTSPPSRTSTPLKERRDLRDASGPETAAAAREAAGPATGGQRPRQRRRRRVVDVTTERNLALIRLHTVFPLVPITDLRALILESDLATSSSSEVVPQAGPYVLWTGVEALLQRARHEQELQRRRRERDRNRRGGGGGAAQLPTEWWNAFVGLLGFSTRDLATNKTSTASADAADPILTPHDLFRSSAYESALIDHLEAVFASSSSTLRRREIERIVRREGGSYASLRQRLEARVLETQGRPGLDREESGGSAGGGLARWWKKLIKVEAPPVTSSSHQLIVRMGRPDAEENPYLRREIEAYEQSRLDNPRIADTPTRPLPTTSTADAPASFECACCFADEPLTLATRFNCSVASTYGGGAHSFCSECVSSLAKNYAFGTSAFDQQALESYSLPCMAATANEPCTGRIARAELDRALNQDLRLALDRRITDAVLERYGVNAVAKPNAGKLVRCPFCPYGELADPLPGPLTATFFPAWVREPFPPSLGDVLRTLVGGLLVLPIFVVVASILAFVTPARRLERAYERISTRRSETTVTGDRTDTPSVLSLPERLLLEPYLVPLVVLSHLASICERVRSQKHGQRTVFRCRNTAGSPAGGGSASRAIWQVVQRMEHVEQDLAWGDEREEADLFVEEVRRQRIVDFVWGSCTRGIDGQEQEATSSCGRLSCLLCHAALNPSAPSLHACAARPSSRNQTTTLATEQERAEESLRLAVEKAMSAAVVRECGRCGVGLTKKGGEGACNKVTCRCGFAFCHACLRPISTFEGYAHFCPHPRDPRDPIQCLTAGCDKCSLWLEPDLAQRRKLAADRAREKWAEENPEWAEKVAATKPLRSVGADLHLVPAYETTLDVYDSIVEGLARVLLT